MFLYLLITVILLVYGYFKNKYSFWNDLGFLYAEPSIPMETSANALTFCTYELAINQDIQDRLRKEIQAVLKKHDEEITYDAIMEMKYLDMVINETLRKYPIFEVQVRKCTKEFKIPATDLVIPIGMPVMIPVVGIQNDEKYFKNPENSILKGSAKRMLRN
ncbi:unnamed protein product [Chironomus riparius]|uniref:Cytochrome P450 n=1 Tax=Chironomus riparius TaxID=315576 RepID=A0A9N9S0J8_9DIPT|nr:unnamed protein product [Chironomus riparius]